MTKRSDPTPAQPAVDFATSYLGPASAALVSRPEARVILRRRLAAGATVEDEVLAYVHRAAGKDRALADEFVAYFLTHLSRHVRTSLGPRVRRFLDTGDLVQSVFGDLWPGLFEIEFTSRAQYLALLTQRIGWKASDHHRRLVTDRRGEDRRIEADPASLGLAQERPSPATQLVNREEYDGLVLRLLRLPERDRELVRRHLRGERPAQIAAAMNLGLDATYKAVQRALRRARELGGGSV